MKIDVYALMRDEIKILPYFLRHYETFADNIFVFDGGSVDGTLEVLRDHPLVRLLPVECSRADDLYYIQSLWPQYKIFSRGQADWCIQVDADEFVYHPNIKEVLQTYTDCGIKKVKCTGFTMWSDLFPTTKGQIYEEVTRGWWDKWQHKTIVFNPEISIRYSMGRHYAYRDGSNPTYHSPDIRILHFRCLGIPYIHERQKKNYKNMNLPWEPWKHHNLPCGGRGIMLDFVTGCKDMLLDALTHPIGEGHGSLYCHPSQKRTFSCPYCPRHRGEPPGKN
jgi:glycosyltransferase involved in cell wall biosynthesis